MARRARTAKQKAASRKNLEKARAARKKSTMLHYESAVYSAKNSRVGAGLGYFAPGGAASHINAVKKAATPKKSTGLPSMGTAKEAKARAFKRKPVGSSAMNAGARAAQKSRKLKSGLT